MTDPTDDGPAEPAEPMPPGPVDEASLPSVRRLSDARYRLFLVLAIGGALGALVLGYRATQPDDVAPITVSARPDVVEQLLPRSGAEVIRQAELGIDLAPGYEGRLVLNGVEIPVDELRLVPEQNQVFFTPGEGLAVERLDPGPNCVTAIVWESAVGRDPATDEAFQWCFEAL
jgi:hypothetical protein